MPKTKRHPLLDQGNPLFFLTFLSSKPMGGLGGLFLSSSSFLFYSPLQELLSYSIKSSSAAAPSQPSAIRSNEKPILHPTTSHLQRSNPPPKTRTRMRYPSRKTRPRILPASPHLLPITTRSNQRTIPLRESTLSLLHKEEKVKFLSFPKGHTTTTIQM